MLVAAETREIVIPLRLPFPVLKEAHADSSGDLLLWGHPVGCAPGGEADAALTHPGKSPRVESHLLP